MSEQCAYCARLEQLFALSRFGEKLDLSTPRALRAALGDPLAAYQSILVGGTNGKGSCSTSLEALLLDLGESVGLFTSPHLNSYRERFRINGVQVSEARLLAVISEVEGKLDGAGIQPSFFELTWAIAAELFRQEGLRWVIWEVGLGGRLDATNACEPVLSLVTSVGLDHVDVLGGSLSSIAHEKAAIFRPGSPALSSATGEGRAALQAACEALKIKPRWVEAPARPLPISLPGAHQQRNAALALAGLEAIGFSPNVNALQAVDHPGRLEQIGSFWVDAAHNPPGAEALALWLRAQEGVEWGLIFGVMGDKDWRGTLEPLRSLVAQAWWVTPDSPRALAADLIASSDQLRPPSQAHHPCVAEAINDARAWIEEGQTGSPRRVLIAGSAYLAGEARAALLGLPYPECGLRTTAR